jgi:hypothetical protein
MLHPKSQFTPGGSQSGSARSKRKAMTLPRLAHAIPVTVLLPAWMLLAGHVPVCGEEADAQPAALPVLVPAGQTQIFVDDVMIAHQAGVQRRTHAAEKLPGPVLEPREPWESAGIDQRVYVYGTVLHDAADGTFRMWYNRLDMLLLATSRDGVAWQRPNLGLVEFDGSKQNNILPIRLHSPSVICDQHEPDPQKRYKLLAYSSRAGGRGYIAAHSADGVRWQHYPQNPVLPGGDTCTLTQDPATGEYLAFHKLTRTHRGQRRRLVYLATSQDMQQWSEQRLVMAPDELDDRTTEAEGGRWSQFYNMSAFSYAGQWLGFVTHFRYSGPPAEQGPEQSGDDGPIDVQLVHSRDARQWQRCSDRRPVIPTGPYAYDAGCILGVSNTPVIVGDQMWSYYTAITTTHGGYLPRKRITIARAAWRVDGLVSLFAGEDHGQIDTVTIRPAGGSLVINCDASRGECAVEVLDPTGRPLIGYGREECLLLRGDAVRHAVSWKSHRQLPAGRDLRLRFRLKNADLYSYTVQDEP